VTSSANFINFNGKILPSGTAVLTPDNRGFRYGDGIFETMAVKNGRIRLAGLHFDRLTAGAHYLQLGLSSPFTAEQLAGEVETLCEKNGHSVSARVRLVLFRGEGGISGRQDPLLNDRPDPDYIIQTSPLPPANDEFNRDGLSIGLFPDARKACDLLSNLKSNNYLLYVLAALYAQKQGNDDCLVLNSQNRIADSTIANLFYVKAGRIYTPPLSEGCVAGVMRRFLLGMLPAAGFDCSEKPVTVEDLAGADEIFLTNALKGIKWVGSFQARTYTQRLTRSLYQELVKKLV
jgi:branched-chain amino acid aminotransferase